MEEVQAIGLPLFYSLGIPVVGCVDHDDVTVVAGRVDLDGIEDRRAFFNQVVEASKILSFDMPGQVHRCLVWILSSPATSKGRLSPQR